MKFGFKSILCVLMVAGSFGLQANARLDDADSDYDLFENTRRSATIRSFDSYEATTFTCPQTCTSMDSENVESCGEYKDADSCIHKGCVWTCK